MGISRPRPSLLTRKPTQLTLPKKFVVAVDGSKMSIRGLQLAAFLMQPNLDTVTIITIGKKNTGAEWMDVDPSTDLEKSLLSGKLTPEQLLGAAQGELLRCGVRPSKVDMEVVDLETDPADAIIKYTIGLRRGAVSIYRWLKPSLAHRSRVCACATPSHDMQACM